MPHTSRRSSDDPEWRKTKDIVDERDKRQCQFERCLSAKEAYMIVGGGPTVKDRCHIFPASSHPQLIYNPRNVITLRRFLHQRMDSYKCPLTGTDISLSEHYYWWLRILKRQIVEYDSTIDYEELLMSEIAK